MHVLVEISRHMLNCGKVPGVQCAVRIYVQALLPNGIVGTFPGVMDYRVSNGIAPYIWGARADHDLREIHHALDVAAEDVIHALQLAGPDATVWQYAVRFIHVPTGRIVMHHDDGMMRRCLDRLLFACALPSGVHMWGVVIAHL